MTKLKNIVIGSSLLGAVFMLNACVTPHGHYSAPYGYSDSSLVYWYYYPNYGVYYHPVDHYYYYQVGGSWRRDARLPAGWVLRGEPRVRLHLSGIPHRRYSDHRHHYPPRRVINVMPGGSGNRHGHQNSPDNDGRHGPGNSGNHGVEVDRKEGRNIFIPHTKEKPKEKRSYDKREGKQELKVKEKVKQESVREKVKQDKEYRASKYRNQQGYKGKQKYEDDATSDNETQPRNKAGKQFDRSKQWFR